MHVCVKEWPCKLIQIPVAMIINSQVGIEGLDLVQTPNGYKAVGGVRSHQYMCIIQRQAMVRFPLLHFVLFLLLLVTEINAIHKNE